MIQRFLNLLIEATRRIPPYYFQLPVADMANPIYRERVYCYELYHQLRCLLDADERFARYSLSGEIDKQGHPIIRPCTPDFVFHHPGRMDNLAVIEVKPANGGLAGIRKDLETLTYFLSPPVGYRCGVHLAYGDDERKFVRFEREFVRANIQHVHLLWHRYQGRPAERVQ